MNSISYHGEIHEFSTTEELFALPKVRQYLDRPDISHLGYAKGVLVAYVCVPVMHEIGRLKEPVVLPKVVRGGKLT